MNKDKMEVLIIPSDNHGVGHFRSIWPAQAIDRYYGDSVKIEINPNPNYNDESYFKRFQIVHFHRQLGDINQTKNNIERLKSWGIVTIIDIDDYWEPFGGHPLYYIIKQEKIDEKIKSFFSLADHVTTTTNVFKKHLLKFNKNVHVLPNAVYPEQKMWRGEDQREEGNDKVRIAWIGGSSHMSDLELLRDSMGMLHSNKELKDKYQIVLCGFDTRGSITEITPDGKQKTRPIKPHETVWKKFEEIMTSNYDLTRIGSEYTNYLNKVIKDPYKNQHLERYVRRWTLPLTQYGKHYDYCDVCIAPINHIDTVQTQSGQIINKNNIFNEVKSELKIIEAGTKKKALIAQEYGIYKELIKDGENGILIPTNKNKKGWYKAMREVINNEGLRNELAENLHKFVSENYNIKHLTEKRVGLYKEVLKKKKANE